MKLEENKIFNIDFNIHSQGLIKQIIKFISKRVSFFKTLYLFSM